MKQPEGLVRGLPNCGIVAIAAALDLPYPQVFEEYRRMFGCHSNWKGRTFNRDREKFIRAKGYEIFELPKQKGTIGRWVKEKCVPGAKYFITSGRHVVFVQNDIIVDQHNVAHYTMHRAARLHVKRVNVLVTLK